MKNNTKEPQTQHTLSVYFCGQEDCGPNHSFGPAMRPHYLLHVIYHGKGIYQCSGHTYHLKAGDAFLIRPMDSIYYRADNTDPWSYAWAGFDGSACKEILKQTVFSDTPIFTPETPIPAKQPPHPHDKAYLTPSPKTTETTLPRRKPPPNTILHAKKALRKQNRHRKPVLSESFRIHQKQLRLPHPDLRRGTLRRNRPFLSLPDLHGTRKYLPKTISPETPPPDGNPASLFLILHHHRSSSLLRLPGRSHPSATTSAREPATPQRNSEKPTAESSTHDQTHTSPFSPADQKNSSKNRIKTADRNNSITAKKDGNSTCRLCK